MYKCWKRKSPGCASEPRSLAPTPPQPAAPTDIKPVVASRIPTLFIVGEEDQLIAPAIIEAMHKKMPGSQFAKVPGAGHSVYFECPDAFNDALAAFLATPAGAAPAR